MKRVLLAVTALLVLAGAAQADVMPNPFNFASAHRIAATVAAGPASSNIAFTFGTGKKALCVQNPVSATESLWIDFGVPAVVGSSMEVPAGTLFCMGGQGIWNGAISVNAATGGHAYQAFEWQ